MKRLNILQDRVLRRIVSTPWFVSNAQIHHHLDFSVLNDYVLARETLDRALRSENAIIQHICWVYIIQASWSSQLNSSKLHSITCLYTYKSFLRITDLMFNNLLSWSPNSQKRYCYWGNSFSQDKARNNSTLFSISRFI